MKKVYILSLAFILSLGVCAQSYVQVGSGTANSSFPYNAWNYSWAKALYKADQVSGSKTIIKFAVEYTSTTSKTLNNQKIYMKCVSATSIDGSYEDAVSSGYTLVFDGNLTFPSAGWQVIDLSQSFEYDGTKSIIVLWENRNGSSPYANFSATETTENVIKVSGSDTGFPTAAGYDPYPKALPNVRFYYNPGTAPTTPQNEVPVTGTKKINVNTNLTFDLGSNTTLYDLYLSTNQTLVTDLDASVRVVTGATVSAPGTFTYTPTTALESKTNYYWRVVAKNATEQTNSLVFAFETQKVLSTFPYTQGFEDNEIWTEGWYGDMTKTDWFYTSTTGSWSKYNGSFHTGANSAKCNPSGTGGEYILMTPRIALPDNFGLSFWWKNTSVLGDGKVQGKDQTYVEISTDGTTSWTQLGTLNPAEETIWSRANYDLKDYDGDNVYIRWRYKREDGQAGIPIYLDDVELAVNIDQPKIVINPAEIQFNDIAVGGKLSLTVNLMNTGTQNLIISSASVDAPFTCTYSGTIAPNEDEDVSILFQPTSEGDFTKTLTFNITGDFSGTNTIELSGGALACITSFFNSFDLSTDLPEGWNALNNPDHAYTKVSVVTDFSGAYSPSNSAKFVMFSDHNYPVTLVAPGITGFDTKEFKFFAKKGGDYNVELIVGTMDDPYGTSSFVEIDRITLTSSYVQYTATIPTDNTKPYIGLRHGGNPADYSVTSIWVDDVSWEQTGSNPPSPADPIIPTADQTNVDIMMPLTFQWAKGAGEPTGYKFSLGTNAEANNLVNNQVVEGGNNISYTPSVTFNYSTNYKWKVIPYNTHGDAVDCPVWSFTTMANPLITTLPYLQNFDGVTNVSGFTYPLGWSIENTNVDNQCWDIISNSSGSPNNAFSAPNAMHVAFHPYNPKNDYLFTPPIQMVAGRSYAVDFKLQTLQDLVTGLVYNEKIKVFFGTDNTSTAMTTEILDTMVNALGWKNPEGIFTVPANGDYFVGFKAYSDANQYLLIIDNVRIQNLYNVTFTVVDSLGAPITDAVLTFNGVEKAAGEYAVNLVKAGNYTYSISKEGFVAAEGTVDVSEDKSVNVELLENRYIITFNIVDQDENVISDATITFNEVEYSAGDYSIDELLAGTYSYSVSKAGYIPSEGEVVVTENMSVDVELVLIVFTVTYVVNDEYEVPITDAIVTFNSIVNTAGDYLIENVIPETYSFSVDKTGYVTVEDEIIVSKDTTVNITLNLERFTVTFNVKDEEGTAITDAIITFNEEVLTAGVYAVNSVLADTYSYSIAKEDFSTYYGELVLTKDTTINVVLIAYQTFTVTFDVIDKNSDPITDAIITFNSEVLASGVYVISELESGNYPYSVEKNGLVAFGGNVSVNKDTTIVATLLPPKYLVTFSVEASAGGPIANASITFTEVEAELFTDNYGDATIELENGEYHYLVSVDEFVNVSGSFTVNSETEVVEVIMYTVGIDDVTANNLLIYPNPACENVWIDLTDLDYSNSIIRIFSITGSTSYTIPASDVRTKINLSGFSKGVYIIIVEHPLGISRSKLLVKK